MSQELLADNRGLVYKLARRYAYIDTAVDMDDLTQAGFIGLIEAEQTYDPTKGKSWAGWAAYYIRREMREATGINSTRERAHLRAVSLDEPISDDDDVTRLDNLADESLPAADDGIIMDERRAAVRAAMSRLEPSRREVVQRYDLRGQSLAGAGECMGMTPIQAGTLRMKALRDMRRDWRLKQALDQDTNFYRHKGVSAFNTDWTSVTEAAALWRIEHGARGQIAAR